MRNHIKYLLCVGLAGALALSARADTYSNVVMSLHPVGYYPLNEVATPPATAASTLMTNYGTDTNLVLDAVADVIYGNSSPLASQPNDSSDYFNGGTSYASAAGDPGLSIQPPFTIEGWFLARNISSTQCPTSDFDGNDSGSSSRSGWLIYMDISNPGQYSFRPYNQNGNSPVLTFNIGAAGSIARDTWNYVVVVADTSGGTTNLYGYLNGALVAGPTVMPSYVPNDGAEGGLSAGCRSDIGFGFAGNIDELAFYPSALSGATVLSHYQAATNPSPVTPYNQLVLAQHPLAYYRFNEATPALSSDYPEPLPVAHNYGSLGASGNGFFTVGSTPGGAAGPTNSGFGGLPSLALDASAASSTTAGPGGFCAPFNPELYNETNAITVAFWAQVPTTVPGYFQTVLGRGDGSWRFDVDPSGDPHWAASPNGDLTGATSLADGNWHFWAGVFDPVSGNGTLYIDGAIVVTAPWAALSSSVNYPLLIGGAPDYYNTARNFQGNVAQVAIFTNALSASQINSLYAGAGGTPPNVVVLINSITVNENASTNITASAGGTLPLSLQWYYEDTSAVIHPAPNGNNLTLDLPTVPYADSGFQYFLIASNAFGVATSSIVSLTVIQGGPTFGNDVTPLFSQLPVGVHDSFSVSGLQGTEPFSYMWTLNSSPIPGATSSSYSFTVAAGTNSYACIISNSYNTINSSTAQVVGYSGAPPTIGFGDGSLWALNSVTGPGSSYPTLANGSLELTDGADSEASSAFYIIPQYVGGFVAEFTYVETNGSADGTTFMVQNSSAGTNALGAGGGDLGFYGINNSAGFEINLYSGANGGSGIAFGPDGETPDAAIPIPPYLPTAPVNLVSGDFINVRLAYVGGVMYAKLTDTTNGATINFSHTFGDLTTVLGGAAGYVGFSGGTGGLASIQAVSNFSFSSTTPPVLTLSTSNNNAIVRWPVSVASGFTLQEATAAAGPYTNVVTTPIVVNGDNQVSVPMSGKAEFFRLILP